MANPDFVDESVADQGGPGPFTVLFPAAWAANQIALIFVSTDGWIPTLTTANGFAIATDVNGNAASVTTNNGTAGAAECGMFVFWKRLVGSNSTTDPAPVIGAAPSGSTMAIELNTYSGCRTTGSPFHIIATGTAASSTSITSPSVTPTLNGCTLVTAAASSNDDQAFNSWTFSGAASPAGQLDSGWHDNTGNATAFVGGRGGYATAGGARQGTSSFAVATKQALITIVLASLNEALGPEEDLRIWPRVPLAVPAIAPTPPSPRPIASLTDELAVTAAPSIPDDSDTTTPAAVPSAPVARYAAASDDELEPTLGDDDSPPPVIALPVAGVRYAAASDDEFSIAAGGVVDDDMSPMLPAPMAGARPLLSLPSDDEVPTATGGAAVDEDGPPVPPVPSVAGPLPAPTSDDEVPTAAGGAAADEDDSLIVAVPAPIVPPLPVATSDDELSPLSFLVDDDVPVPSPAPVGSVAPLVRLPEDEFPGGSLPPGVDLDDFPRPVAVALPRVPISTPAPADEIVVLPATGIGGAGDMQRSLSQPPATGTLTTVAPVPAWATSTAYVVDPSQGGINRVTNGGNLYQCRVAGTSASSGGGPTGTGTNIADGSTVRWYFVGPAQGTNTAAGSQVLVTVMRGDQSTVGAIGPSDNDGGTFTVITNNSYASFTASFAGVWRRNTATNAKTNYQASAAWGGSGGAGDEMSIGWVELQGVRVGAPHAFSQVERASATGGLGGTVTSAPITTTVPCVIVSFWFGNGNVQTQGTPDAATPTGGLTLIAGCTGPLSLTPNGYIQHMVAWRKQTTPATNFTETWTASPTDEGAQLVTVAFEDLNVTATLAAEDDAPVRPRVVAWMSPLRALVASDDELSPPADADADNDAPRMLVLPAAPVTMEPAPADDEVAGLVIVEDDGTPVVGALAGGSLVLTTSSDLDELPAIPLEEWGQVMAVPVVLAPPPVVTTSDDETATAAPIDEDNTTITGSPVAAVLPLVAAQSDDEIAAAGGASQIEEDATVTIVPTVLRPILVVPPSVDEVGTASGASAIEDETVAQPPVRVVAPVTSLRISDDEVGTALAVDEDQPAMAGAVAQARPPLPSVADDDAFALATLDEDQPVASGLPAPVAALLYVASDDDLPIAALLDEVGQLLAMSWSSPVLQQLTGDDEPPAAATPAAIVDEDQLLAPLLWQVSVPLRGPIIADELPKPKKARPAGSGGTGLLDGFIAKQVAQAMTAAKLYKPGVLIKVTPGVRTPGAISAGTNPTTASYKFKGLEQNLLSLQLAGTLINGVDAAIRIFGATIEGGQVPVPGDKIQMAGKTYTIVAGGVSRDSASACYVCQAKL